MDKIEEIAVIVYGDGAELGNFRIFADNLVVSLKNKYKRVVMQYINRDNVFFDFLASTPRINEKIGELHIFSHAIGAGLFLGYKDSLITFQREQLWLKANSAGRRVTYDEAVNTEIGAIQTDDLFRPAIIRKQPSLKKLFVKNSFIKIWGCNSGVSNWVYSDGGVTDAANVTEPYYWRAFNERNIPKLSIAQALANYFNIKVFGAMSGASIEVFHDKKWKSSETYKQQIGHWPSGSLPHKLVPDKGDYSEFSPH